LYILWMINQYYILIRICVYLINIHYPMVL
jgi:Domain of unknown function (DUF1934).